ncbi:MAG TPA: patatin-like phospholipase family protein [Nitrososphaeraceae archaeon]|jgi:predicted acylesterase/phospholipase RssA|nr:patatin-like phospholipase family protein [Nitrososphaeraceae archaeon]
MIDTRKDNSSNNNDRKLIFVKNKSGKTAGIPTRQSALILQGGGALGTYEIGVLQSIYKHLAKDNGIDKKSKRAESIFDIVAGVSIGAINAVFLIDQILKNNSWDNSITLLERFWDNFIAHTLVDRNPLFDFAWNTTRFF